VSRFFLPAALALFVLGGCAVQPRTDSSQDALRARVEAYEQARQENNFQLSYTFTSPGYRETHPYKFYLGKMGAAVKRHSHEIKDVACREDACTVTVLLKYSYLGEAGARMGADTIMERDMVEQWIRVDNEWWIVPDR